jgi:hypothetical protein
MEGIAFRLAEGRAVGLTDARMRHPRFVRPHHGLRLLGSGGRIDGDGPIDRCADLLTVLPHGALFSHATAARLWGFPLPTHIGAALHVLVPGEVPVRRPGVIGWTRVDDFPDTRMLHGMPVTTPADTWAMLGGMTDGRGGRVSREWLVAIGDFLVSGRRRRRGREPALATPAELTAALARHGSRRGAAALAWAVARVRSPVDSPPETFIRLGLVAARLPEPVVQPAIPTAVGLRHPDLGYLDERILIEYLGDVHRIDRDTWRSDLTRVQLFEDAGYRVILAGADDVTPEGLPLFAARLRRALRRG